MKRFSILFALWLGLVSFGCGPKVPDGFPERIPWTVKVMKDGRPLEGAHVSLSSLEGNESYSIAGDTNASGIAPLKTSRGSFVASGAPVGEYKVTVAKAPTYTETKPADFNEWSADEAMAYLAQKEEERAKLPPVLQEIYTDLNQTPLRITIRQGENSSSIEVK